MPKTKPRIDKKSAITFRLVHRSQHDPLIADETAPQHVLQEVGKETVDPKEEQVKYGIYFDDDYDYLKHLKTREEFERGWEMVEEKQKVNKGKINLPSSVFPSIIEEDEGMLNKAAPVTGPQLDMDPDIVQAMDDDFDLENPANQLTDDYLTEILEGGIVDEGQVDEDDDDEYNDEDEEEREPGYSMARFQRERLIYDDDGQQEQNLEKNDQDSDSWDDDEEEECNKHLPSGLRRKFSKEETKSVFTEYSLTSSVQHRNEGLSMIDERFEALYEREYADEMETGACDLDDIEGPLDPNNCYAIRQLIEEEKAMKEAGTISGDEKLKTLVLNGVEGEEIDSDDERGLEQLEIQLDAGKHHERLYDCESVLSTYSTLYNHPKLIRTTIRKSNKLTIDPSTGLVVPPNTGLTKKNLRELDCTNGPENCAAEVRSNYSRASRISELSERDPDETPEERKARKAAFKEMKRERRFEKKANKTAFKMESHNQQRDLVRLKNGMNTMKLV